jgi:hypothetical protein
MTTLISEADLQQLATNALAGLGLTHQDAHDAARTFTGYGRRWAFFIRA